MDCQDDRPIVIGIVIIIVIIIVIVIGVTLELHVGRAATGNPRCYVHIHCRPSRRREFVAGSEVGRIVERMRSSVRLDFVDVDVGAHHQSLPCIRIADELRRAARSDARSNRRCGIDGNNFVRCLE